jgi:hypothetical protein
MTVRQMLSVIDSEELTEWLAYDQIEPFGQQREDLRAGLICSTVANHSISPPKNPLRPSDFMLFVEKRKAEPVLLEHPKSQSDLIRQVLFGMTPR